jgi:hypothetical protein
LIIVSIAASWSAEATSLALSSVTVIPGDVASLDLSLQASADARPAAIQWIFQYSPASISRFTVEDGPALSSAGKTVICSGDANALKCLIVGLNREAIPDGIVAKVSVVLEPGVSSATILVTDALGVSGGGDPISISSTNGTITAANPPPARESRPRSRERD